MLKRFQQCWHLSVFGSMQNKPWICVHRNKLQLHSKISKLVTKDLDLFPCPDLFLFARALFRSGLFKGLEWSLYSGERANVSGILMMIGMNGEFFSLNTTSLYLGFLQYTCHTLQEKIHLVMFSWCIRNKETKHRNVVTWIKKNSEST